MNQADPAGEPTATMGREEPAIQPNELVKLSVGCGLFVAVPIGIAAVLAGAHVGKTLMVATVLGLVAACCCLALLHSNLRMKSATEGMPGHEREIFLGRIRFSTASVVALLPALADSDHWKSRRAFLFFGGLTVASFVGGVLLITGRSSLSQK